MTRRARLTADRGGIASVELALLAALVLVPLIAAATDFGLILVAWAATTRAEQAGLFYAFANGCDTAGIRDAALAAYGGLTAAPTVSADSACYCLSSSQPWSRGSAPTVSCTSACASGTVLTEFLNLSVTASVPLPVPLPGLASPYLVAATAAARLQ